MKKIALSGGVMALVMAAVAYAANEFSDPFSNVIWTKVLPVVQGIGSTLAVLALIYAAVKRMSGDPEKVDEANKWFIGIAVALIVIWVAPAFVKWLIALITG